MGKVTSRNEHLQLVMIYEVSKILGASLDLPKTLHQILNILSIYLEIRRGMISLIHESGVLQLAATSGVSGDEMRRCRDCVGEDFNGNIFKTGLPIVVSDLSAEPRFRHCTHKLESAGKSIALIGVPIKSGREILGVISIERVIHGQGNGFEQDVHLLKLVANLVGQTVRLHHSLAGERPPPPDRSLRAEQQPEDGHGLVKVIGTSRVMQQVFAEVHQSAPSRSTVLLRGESGTGKEVIARAIHELSPRRDGPFIKVNCAALSETLLESELFGHEKGAFTGAQTQRKGRFELADGGTLFLDEIGEISPAFQAKLLRVLQEREFERVGGSRPIKVNFRLVAATNRDLEKAVANGEFRGDLYFRINVVSIFMPSLRERREDILPLVGHFLTGYNRENLQELTISPEGLDILENCHWPGNVRELENCVERTATMARGKVIRDHDFMCRQNKCLTKLLHESESEAACAAVARADDGIPVEAAVAAPVGPASRAAQAGTLPGSERDRLLWALEQARGVQTKAARLLNISPRQLGYALHKHDIRVKKF